MTQLNIRLPEKLHRNFSLVIVGLIIIIATSLLTLPQRNTPPTSSPPSLPNNVPSVSVTEISPFKIIGYSPRNLNPSIANTHSAVYFEFNKPLTDIEIANLQLITKPAVIFKKIAHTNRKIIYFTPISFWKDQTLYTITISSPSDPDLKTFFFSPTSYVSPEGGVSDQVPNMWPSKP